MRIKTLSGSVIAVEKVVPCKEQVVPKFTDTGKDIIIRKQTKNVNDATGVYFEEATSDMAFEACYGKYNQLYIGNLTNAQVREILDDMYEDGYFDVNAFDYQNVEDDGKIRLGQGYLPYCSEKTNVKFYAINQVAKPFIDLCDDADFFEG